MDKNVPLYLVILTSLYLFSCCLLLHQSCGASCILVFYAKATRNTIGDFDQLLSPMEYIWISILV